MESSSRMDEYRAAVRVRLQARFEKLVDHLHEHHAGDCAAQCLRMAAGIGVIGDGRSNFNNILVGPWKDENPAQKAMQTTAMVAFGELARGFSADDLNVELTSSGAQNPKGEKVNDTVRMGEIRALFEGQLVEDDPVNLKTIIDGVFDWIRRNGSELVERTAWTMTRMVDGQTPGKGYLVPDDPPGFLRAVLGRAADSFPWTTSTDLGRLLHVLVSTIANPPTWEFPLWVFPPAAALQDVARWMDGHMFFGVRYNTPGIEKMGWFPIFEHAPTAPEGLDPLPGFLPPAAFAVLYLSKTEVERWHAPASDRHGGHVLAARAVLDTLKEYKKDDDARRDLAERIYEHEARIREEIGFPENLQERIPDDKGKMLFADSALAQHLESLGDSGQKAAKELRRKSRKLWKESAAGADLYWWWMEAQDLPPRFVQALARVLWLDVVQPERETPPFMIPSVLVRGSAYAKMPKAAGSISWSLGAPGIGIEIDGSKYAQAPKVARYLSRGISVLPASARPSQRTLPIEILAPEDTPFALRAVGDTQYVISPTGGKLLLLALATAKQSGMIKGTVAEVTRALNPNKQRIRARDYEITARAAWEQNRVRLILPDDTSVALLDVRMPRDPATAIPEQIMSWAYGPNFLDFAKQHGMKPLRGDFIMNLSGAMSLSAKEHPLLRQYIFACSLWNDSKNPSTGRFDPQYLPAYDIKTWALQTNTLSTAAVDYLREHDPKKRHKLSRDRKLASEALESLNENHGLVVVKKTGRDRFKVLPPDSLLEAFEKFRGGAKRPVEPEQLGAENEETEDP